VFPRALKSTHILGRVEVALDQLDQAVDVLGGHRVVLLVEVVNVAVQDLDEQLDADGRVHAGVGDAQGALQAFEDALAVAVGLRFFVSVVSV
jgi:hypothetical protein